MWLKDHINFFILLEAVNASTVAVISVGWCP